MSEELKKHIDKILKRKLKVAKSLGVANLPTVGEGQSEEVDYYKWLQQLTSQKMEWVHPRSEEQADLVDILSCDVLYKQSFKSLCDTDHPAAIESLEKIGLDNEQSTTILQAVKEWDELILEYCDLFKDELKSDGDTLIEVQKKITEMSIDSAQGTVISHSAKMTNPACKFPKIYSISAGAVDGFVRTGNAVVDFDMHINATKLKVFKFLSLCIGGKRVFDLINENNTACLSQTFLAKEKDAELWVENFKSAVNSQDYRTHHAIKQVYFPIEGNYHQLSIVTPSGLVFSLKEKIDFVNGRSKDAFIGKKAQKSNSYSKNGFSSLSNLTVTKHGGDHPKNISGLNNKYQTYYLLQSAPPKLKNRGIHFPKSDFFNQTVNYFQCKSQFHHLHKLFSRDDNNMHIRTERDEYYQSIIDHIIEKMWQVRSVSSEQYNPVINQLPAAQTTWLCEHEEVLSLRETTDDWLDVIMQSIVTFLFHGYEKVLGKKAIKFSDVEHKHLHKAVIQNKEALR